jgi:hypothetical protein
MASARRDDTPGFRDSAALNYAPVKLLQSPTRSNQHTPSFVSPLVLAPLAPLHFLPDFTNAPEMFITAARFSPTVPIKLAALPESEAACQPDASICPCARHILNLSTISTNFRSSSAKKQNQNLP